MDSPQRQPSLEFPPPLIGELGGALALYVARRTEPELEGVRHALEQLCTVAHRQGLGPERMVIAVKEAWAALPETQRAPSQRETDALRGLFERVLTACLDSYYESRDRSEPPPT